MTHFKTFLLAGFLSIGFFASASATQDRINADTVIYGGTIYTADDSNPKAEALAIKDGRFIFVGSRNDLAMYIGDTTQEIDLGDNVLFPGFMDAHAHLAGIGERELSFNLEGTSSISDLQKRIESWRENHPDEAVIIGRGWIETHWPSKRFPSRFDIDQVVSDIPVVIVRADGHALVVNTKALEVMEVDATTPVPFGGEIHRNALGELTGVLVDNAISLVSPLGDKATKSTIEERLIAGGKVYARYGWTGLYNLSVDWSEISPMEALSDRGDLSIRVNNALMPEYAENLFRTGARVNRNERIKTKAIKLYMDGALGSRGAALLEPYSDSDSMGLITQRKEDVMPIMQYALSNGFQILTHAIGDRANREVLDWYEEVFAEIPESDRAVADPRWRIEHAQHINAADIPRFKTLGVIPSMQPSHAIGDLHFAPDRLGDERLSGAYAWQTLIDSGVIISGGSDAPVERGNPLIEFYAAAARMDLNGFQGANWHPELAVSRENALKMFTLWPAIAALQEDDLGTITVGKKADLTAFNADIMTIDAAEIIKAKAMLTMVDGDIIYIAE